MRKMGAEWKKRILSLHRKAPEKVQSLQHFRDAAVLMPLVEKDRKLFLLFEVRSSSIAQGGEICFPGGRIEKNETAGDAALRETCEELCLTEDQVHLISPMHRMGAPGGGEVTSFLGTLSDYQGTYEKDEVDHVILVPLSFFLETKPRVSRAKMCVALPDDFPYELIPGGKNYPFRSVPRTFYFYQTEQGVIWGMTAELVFNLIETLKEDGILS